MNGHIYKTYLLIGLISCILLPAVSIHALAQQATATLDTGTILIGRHVKLTLDLKNNHAQKVEWPLISDTIGEIEVIQKGPVDTISSGQSVLHRRQQLIITAFDSGYYVIPPFNFMKPGSQASAASTNPLLLTVEIMPVDTTKAFKDIKNIAEVPLTWRDYIGYIIAVMILLILIYIGYIIYKRYKQQRPMPFIAKAEPVIPAHVAALNALQELDNGKYWQNGQYKYYHSAISGILRTYIERRWEVPAMEQTTDEILRSSLSIQLTPELIQKLNYILRIADLAKFAKLQPLAHENEQAMHEARAFIENTKPVMVGEEEKV